MPDPGSVEKVTITNLTTNESITCPFNPKELTISKSVSWHTADQAQKDVSHWSFGGGNPAKLPLDLLFDTTSTGDDVRKKYTNFLLGLLAIDTSKKDDQGNLLNEPVDCRVSWGKFMSFLAVAESVDLTFTYFLSDGTPVRAKARVTFRQKKDEQDFAAQNPTTRTEARKVWMVCEGETLDWIAYREYGNPAHWRHIAATNDLADPMDLRAGQVLKLVPLPASHPGAG